MLPESYYTQPTLKNWGVMFPLLGAGVSIYLEFCMGDLCFLPLLFICHTLGYNPILLYLIKIVQLLKALSGVPDAL